MLATVTTGRIHQLMTDVEQPASVPSFGGFGEFFQLPVGLVVQPVRAVTLASFRLSLEAACMPDMPRFLLT